jgi:hypothetical protein
MYKLLERANEKGYRIFFFGAKEEVLQKVLRKVRTGYPGVQIAGCQHGYFTGAEESAIVRKIQELGRRFAQCIRNTQEGVGRPSDICLSRMYRSFTVLGEFWCVGRSSSPRSAWDAKEWLRVAVQTHKSLTELGDRSAQRGTLIKRLWYRQTRVQ